MSYSGRHKEGDVTKFNFSSFDGEERETSGEGIAVIEHQERPLDSHLEQLKIRDSRPIDDERAWADKNNFNILPIVKRHRGIEDLELRKNEEKIKRDVAEKLYEYKSRAYRSGLERGKKDGFKSIRDEFTKKVEEDTEVLADYIANVQREHAQLLQDQKSKIYELVRALTKWVILRELKNDGEYLERLLDKLVLELNSKSNLVLKVGSDNFENISGAIEILKNKFDDISNVRVEALRGDGNLLKKGMILESENEILDGTFKAQFKNLDKLFDRLKSDE